VIGLLGQRWGEVRQGKKSGVDFVDELAVHFRLFVDTLPLRVVLEDFQLATAASRLGCWRM